MQFFENSEIPIFKKGSGIHIKKENRGKFTDYCNGKVTQECIDKAKKSGNKKLIKRAVFAENARKWKHQQGGIIIEEIITPEEPIVESPMVKVGINPFKNIPKSDYDKHWQAWYDQDVQYYQPEKDSEMDKHAKNTSEQAKNFYKQWYSNPLRKAVYTLNKRDNTRGYDVGTLQDQFDKLDKASFNFAEISGPVPLKGGYNPRTNQVFINSYLWDNPVVTALHEFSHAADPKVQEDKTKSILEKRGYTDSYWDGGEAFQRLMEFRMLHGVDPNKFITEQDIQNFRNNKDIEDPDMLNRYDDKTMQMLLNLVAQNKSTKNDQLGVSFAQKGSRLIPRIITPIINKLMPKKKQEVVQQPTQQPTKRLDMQSLKNDPEYKQFDLYMSEPDLNQLQDSLISRNAGFPQRVAILTNAIAENGGRPDPHGNGAFGVMGWRGPRAIGLPADLPGQLHKLMVESYENPSGKDWTHGGAGTGVQTGKEMYELYNNSNNIQQATKAFMKGYVRPGKEEWDKRLRLADLVKKHMK